MKKQRVFAAFQKLRGSFSSCGFRDVAQLVAHYVRDVGVASSSPVIPTRRKARSLICQ